MGPSGCGKTTLLNVLSGYLTSEKITGTLKVREARKQSYILQEEGLHSLLTVKESMMFSMHLKIGSGLSIIDKKAKVKKILSELGLEQRMEAFVGSLSGGQQRRLSIAIELVDDPSVLFLDEPTTGLDSSSSTQCIQLLRKLVREGKTVVCTIHTPSALLFKMFDHLYVMANGRCIYQGNSDNVVKFLCTIDLKCPASYNPSDFLMEIANGDYGPNNDRLTEKIKNGAIESYRNVTKKLSTDEFALELQPTSIPSNSFLNQLRYLLARNFLILYRDKTIMWLRLTVHVSVSLLVGLVFQGYGNNASKIFGLFKLIYALSLFLMYTGFYSMFTKFALDAPKAKREHFNRWYSTPAYYIAMTLTDIPLTIACAFLTVANVYKLSEMATEEFRFTTLFLIQLLLSFVAQGFGMMIGSLFTLMVSTLTQ